MKKVSLLLVLLFSAQSNAMLSRLAAHTGKKIISSTIAKAQLSSLQNGSEDVSEKIIGTLWALPAGASGAALGGMAGSETAALITSKSDLNTKIFAHDIGGWAGIITGGSLAAGFVGGIPGLAAFTLVGAGIYYANKDSLR